MKVDYRVFCPMGTSKDERRKLDVGDIFQNGAKCLSCGQVLVSTNRHDFNTCSCGNLSVDGGSWYARRVYGDENKYEDNIVYYEGEE